MRSRSAFTRVDAVASIVLSVVLAGMALPAQNKVQEAANRMKTTNHLKMIALAYHNHNDVYFALPYNGGANDADGLKKVNYGWASAKVPFSGTWATQILPFVEQDALFRNLEITAESTAPPKTYPDDKLWQVEVKEFLCAERARKGVKTKREGGCYPGPVTDFAINVFLNAPPTVYSQDDKKQNAFAKGEVKPGTNGDWAAAQSKMTIQGVPDGSSNTLMVGGKAMPPAMFKSNVAFESNVSFAPVPAGGDGDDPSKGDQSILSPGNWTIKDGKKALVSTGTGRGHSVVADPPKGDQKDYPKDGGVPWMYKDDELAGDKMPADWELAWGGPYAGGVLFAFGDGSVRVVKYSLKGTANFARLLYPSDGGVVTLD